VLDWVPVSVMKVTTGGRQSWETVGDPTIRLKNLSRRVASPHVGSTCTGTGHGPEPPRSLSDCVARALRLCCNAIEQRHLALICEKQHLRCDGAMESSIVEMTARQITASLSERGESEYTLALPDGQPNHQRLAFIERYFTKAVCAKLRPG